MKRYVTTIVPPALISGETAVLAHQLNTENMCVIVSTFDLYRFSTRIAGMNFLSFFRTILLLLGRIIGESQNRTFFF